MCGKLSISLWLCTLLDFSQSFSIDRRISTIQIERLWSADKRRANHASRLFLSQSPVAGNEDSEDRTQAKTRTPKKTSKFSQLMSEQKTPLLDSSHLDSILDDLASEDDNSNQSNFNSNWSLIWNRVGTLDTLHSEAPNVNCPPSIYTCHLPDDEICMTYDAEGGSASVMNTKLIEIHPPPLHNKREIHYIPSLLTGSQVQSLVNVIEYHINLNCQQDVSGSKTKCLVAVEDGERQYDDSINKNQCLARLLEPMIQQQILPAARYICNEQNMVVADSLVRWYIAEEGGMNEALPPHYDVTSFATMIIPLNPEECEGGLYLQYGAGHDTRHTVDFHIVNETELEKLDDDEIKTSQSHGMKRGDAIIHSYDVMHGVQLREGTRYSLVLWMAQDEVSMKTLTVPWIKKDAENRKSVHAAFLYGNNAKEGIYGIEKNLDEAKEYLEWASARGHALSQYNLAMLLTKLGYQSLANDHESDQGKQKAEWNARIFSLLQESADRGLDLSQHALATIYKEGYHGVTKDFNRARKYYAAAAKQGYNRSIEVLADGSRWKLYV